MSTERASIMWRNGTMPQTYSPPATGVDSARVMRERPGIIVGRRHVLEPEEADPGIFDAPADIDRLLGTPALVDVAHQLDVGADRLTDLDHPLDLDAGLVSPGSAIWVFISRQPLSLRVAAALTTRSSESSRISAPEA